jgi:hypothetical protein
MSDSQDRWRFTGENPPPELLVRYPNWEYALDEEEVEGQDETTLKPEEQQKVIGEFTAFTGGVATLADGRELPALIETISGEVWGFQVYDSEGVWRLTYEPNSKWWQPYVESWLPVEQRCHSVSLADERLFPLRVRSTLPRQATNKPWEVTINRAGA